MGRARWLAAAGFVGILAPMVGCPASRPTAGPSQGVQGDAAAPADASAASDASTPDAASTLAAGALRVQLEALSGFGRRRGPPTDVCEPARENLDRATRAIVAADRSREQAAVAQPWDRSTPPKYMKALDDRFALTASEKAMLAKNGFVVPARLTSPKGYADTFHELYQSQVPIYVSVDFILHALFKSNDAILMSTEIDLTSRLSGALEKMHGELAKQRDYPPEVARDVDLYLTVARSLLEADPVKSVLGTDADAAPYIAGALKGAGGLAQVTLFGRSRIVDFSQYSPRGHYTKREELTRWFRATMWLSRLELNLVSRASRSSQPGFVPNPEETPREAVDALAIADLADRAGVLGDLDALDTAWTQFAGKREDVPIRALLAMKKQAGITTLSVPDSAEKLKAQIGANYQRTTRMHYMPQGSTPLPAIATMLGPRVVADAQAETELVHSHVAGRFKPSFADIAFMLGHERARTWLAPEIASFPGLLPKLEKGKAIFAAAQPTDMYAAWLGALRGLSATPTGAVPSFMKTEAFRDLRVNSTVAGYGQLRHNYVLLAGQAYDEGGCEVPEGYIEPAVEVYEAIKVYAQRGLEAMKAVDGSQESKDYFGHLDKTMSVLLAISRDELAGRPLSEEEKRWMSMIVEIIPPSSDGPGSYDGWYFDLFPRIGDAFDDHAFVADWFTSSNANAVVYAAASMPRIGLFVVDSGGVPRIMVGPVARAFEHVAPLDRRLNDADALKVRDVREPWAASYTAPAPALPPLAVISLVSAGSGAFAVRSVRPLGPVRIELLGHHREVIGKTTMQVGTDWTVVSVPALPGHEENSYTELVRVRIGDVSHDIWTGYSDINDAIGGMKPVAYDALYPLREKLEKRLPHTD